MPDANRDNNRIPVALGVSSLDGITPVELEVNPVNDQLSMDVANDAGRAITVGTRITRDANNVPVAAGVSSVDGITPVPFHVGPNNGRLMIES